MRKRKLQSTALLTEEQIRAAYTVYRVKGISVLRVADLVWERYGFKNVRTCETSLHRAFKSRGWKLRPRSQACRLHKQAHYGTTRVARGADGKQTPEYRRWYERERRKRSKK